jgi:hypothetical protein
VGADLVDGYGWLSHPVDVDDGSSVIAWVRAALERDAGLPPDVAPRVAEHDRVREDGKQSAMSPTVIVAATSAKLSSPLTHAVEERCLETSMPARFHKRSSTRRRGRAVP